MAHFALVDDSNIVREVITLADSACKGGKFPASESIGRAFIAAPEPNGLGREGVWYQTSYNAKFRGIYAGVGWSYDPTTDVFVPPTVVFPVEEKTV